jgi:hypothetical protein
MWWTWTRMRCTAWSRSSPGSDRRLHDRKCGRTGLRILTFASCASATTSVVDGDHFASEGIGRPLRGRQGRPGDSAGLLKRSARMRWCPRAGHGAAHAARYSAHGAFDYIESRPNTPSWKSFRRPTGSGGTLRELKVRTSTDQRHWHRQDKHVLPMITPSMCLPPGAHHRRGGNTGYCEMINRNGH